MSQFVGRTARTNVIATNDITTITENTPNKDITANMTSQNTTIGVEQYFRALVAGEVISDAHNTVTVDNVQAAIEQLESQFSRGATDPTTGTEDYLDNGDLLYNTSTNQLKVYRDGTWQILLQAEGDMDTLDGNTF